ncbi:MAG: hypothetical protein ACE5HO_14580 [bacterium]
MNSNQFEISIAECLVAGIKAVATQKARHSRVPGATSRRQSFLNQLK